MGGLFIICFFEKNFATYYLRWRSKEVPKACIATILLRVVKTTVRLKWHRIMEEAPFIVYCKYPLSMKAVLVLQAIDTKQATKCTQRYVGICINGTRISA